MSREPIELKINSVGLFLVLALVQVSVEVQQVWGTKSCNIYKNISVVNEL